MRPPKPKNPCKHASSITAKKTKAANESGTSAQRKSNLIDLLIEERITERYSVSALAIAANVTPWACKTLEKGKGPVETLNAVMAALPLGLNGIGKGRELPEQLRNRREKRGLTIPQLAAKTGLTEDQIIALENGGGTVPDLLCLLGRIAPTVSRRKRERVYWAPIRKFDRDSRFTPNDFMQMIYKTFGPIDLDPCGHELSPVVAKHRFLFADGDDGLTQPWSGRFVYVNPPYSAQLKWLRRAHEQWQNGNVETVLCLVPARLDSKFFHETVSLEGDIFILRGRVKFLDLNNKPQATPFSLMLVAFGATAAQKDKLESELEGFWMERRSKSAGPTWANSAIMVAEGSELSPRIYQYPEMSCLASQQVSTVICGPSDIMLEAAMTTKDCV